MRRIAGPAFAGILALTACSLDAADYSDEAENFIEDEDGELANQTGQIFTDAACEDPESTELGATFSCTATAAAGETWAFTGQVGEDNTVLVLPLGPDTGAGTDTTSDSPATTTATTLG